MKRTLGALLVAISLLGVLAVTVRSQQPLDADPDGVNQVSDFMRAKLEHSKNVLEGIALEDYDLIAKNSQDLSLLSLAATWQVLQTPEYMQHSGEFRRASDALRDAAKEENLDGAALAYMEVTMKCVNCHKYVRGVRIASRDAVLPTAPEAQQRAAR